MRKIAFEEKFWEKLAFAMAAAGDSIPSSTYPPPTFAERMKGSETVEHPEQVPYFVRQISYTIFSRVP